MTDLTDVDECALARLERIGGPKLSAKMIELFLLQASDKIEAAMRAHRDGSIPSVTNAMHSLKSSAGNVGARTMQQLAESIEQNAPTADREWIGNRLAELLIAYQRVAPLLLQRKETAQI